MSANSRALRRLCLALPSPKPASLLVRTLTTSRALRSPPSSTPDPSKPIVLEKPDRFRPPSHPARLRRRKPRMTYGRELTPEDRQELDAKQYPYMMPPPGSLMHRILHARNLHVVLSISVLVTIVIGMNVYSFQQRNRFPDLTPSGTLFLRSPAEYVRQMVSVYQLNQAEWDREQKEKRDRSLADQQKRQEFRRQHDIPEVTGLAAWLGIGTVEEEKRLAEKKQKEEQASGTVQQDAPVADDGAARQVQVSAEQKPKRKVWFGIW